MAVELAVIGAGNRGHDKYGEYIKSQEPAVKIVAVVDFDEEKRLRMAQRHGIPDNRQFKTTDEFFKAGKIADGVIVATPDREHTDLAINALTLGYHVLLEKPMATTPEECVSIVRAAEQSKTVLMICHVLRYTKFFSLLKEIIDSGRIGEIVTIQHNENIGYWHYIHSYVRGNWRSSRASSPIILAKSCHDLDILLWLTGSRTENISSYGELSFFKESNAPKGAAKRCTDGCPVEKVCAFSAMKMYLGEYTGWPVSVISVDKSLNARRKALENGPYGRCVFHSDNDVCDHQVVGIEFGGGVTSAFTLSAFTLDNTRTIKVMGTKGLLRGHMDKWEVEVQEFLDFKKEVIKIEPCGNEPGSGHGGGDGRLLDSFVEVVKTSDAKLSKTTARLSLESHMMAFAAEESRISGQNISMKDYYQRYKALDLRPDAV